MLIQPPKIQGKWIFSIYCSCTQSIGIILLILQKKWEPICFRILEVIERFHNFAIDSSSAICECQWSSFHELWDQSQQQSTRARSPRGCIRLSECPLSRIWILLIKFQKIFVHINWRKWELYRKRDSVWIEFLFYWNSLVKNFSHHQIRCKYQ